MRQGTKVATRDRPRSRKPLSKALQVRVFRRDNWLCHWCLRPVVFAPSLRLLEVFAKHKGHNSPLAYYHLNYRRDRAPLLDEQAAMVDHVEAHSRGGSRDESNLVTACNRCNMIKGDKRVDQFIQAWRRHRVKGKHGEPKDWDGFTALFVLLAGQDLVTLTESESAWLRALKAP